MADEKPRHFLRQRETDRIYYPEPELVNRPDMVHVMGFFDEEGDFNETGPFTGQIREPEEKDPSEMSKKELQKHLIEDLGVIPSNVYGLKVVELRDMVYEIRQSNEELGGEGK